MYERTGNYPSFVAASWGLTFWGIDRRMCNARTAQLTALNVVSPLSGKSTTKVHRVGLTIEP